MGRFFALVTTTTPDSPLDAFAGSISPTRVPFFYQAGLGVVALAMVLLPLVYVGLIVAMGWLVWWHLMNDITIFEHVRGRAVVLALLAYLGPAVVGLIFVLFLIKPLFSRAPKAPPSFKLSEADEPLLFEFVKKICGLVGAPVPREIRLDTQVNASAGFRLAGSSEFPRTAVRLRLLGAAHSAALQDAYQTYQNRELPDDLPTLVVWREQTLPEAARVGIQKAATEAKTAWNDTHPADADRVKVAAAWQAEGVFHHEVPAAELFTDFAATSQAVTRHFFLHELEVPASKVRFRETASLLRDRQDADSSDSHLDAFSRAGFTSCASRPWSFASLPGGMRPPTASPGKVMRSSCSSSANCKRPCWSRPWAVISFARSSICRSLASSGSPPARSAMPKLPLSRPSLRSDI